MSSGGGSTKVILLALFANFGIAISKFVGAAITQSTSLLAEAIHSLVDCANQLMLLWGGKASLKAPTREHPLGYGREAFFWSFMVAIFLFSLGGLFAIYEGVHKIQHPEPINRPEIALGILMVGIILEAISFRACLREVRSQYPQGSLWTWFRRTTSADLLVIFTEDLAAMLGLILATVFTGVSAITGASSWDAVGSIVVGVVLVAVAFLLAIEVKSLVIGEAPSVNYEKEVGAIFAAEIPGSRILNLIALQTGSSEVMLAVKIHPGESRSVASLIEAINASERKVRVRFPEVRWQFVEPDTEN